MLKNKKILTILLAIVMVLAIPTIANAALDYERAFPSSNGTIELNVKDLTLNTETQYSFALVTAGGTPSNWHIITSVTAETAVITLNAETQDIKTILKSANEGQLFMIETNKLDQNGNLKDEYKLDSDGNQKTNDQIKEEYVVYRETINLKLPYDKAISYDRRDGGFYIFPKYSDIGINGYYFQKITNPDIIEDWLEIKSNGKASSDLVASLGNVEKPNVTFSKWSSYSPNNWGHIEGGQVKNDGLYLLWIEMTGTKNIYGYIIHDGLPEATTVAQYIGEQDVPVETIELNYPTMTLEPGKSLNLVPTIKPENATNKNVTYVSSNAEVATVDATGKVTAIKAGTATITVTTAEGEKKATCTVTVTEPSNEPTDEPTNEEWTDFSNAKFELKKDMNTTAKLEISNVTPKEGSFYYLFITSNGNKPNITLDDRFEGLSLNYNKENKIFNVSGMEKYIELNQDIYVAILEVQDYKNSNVVLYGKKLEKFAEPKYTDAFFATFMSYDYTQIITNFTHSYMNTRNMRIKVGQITDTSILQKIKNKESSGFIDLLAYAKENKGIYDKNHAIEKKYRIQYVSDDQTSKISLTGLQDEEYYFLYIEVLGEDGKFIPLETVSLARASVHDNGEWYLFFYGDEDFKWADFGSVPKDETNAPVKLPNTGNTVFVVVGIVTLAVLSTIGFIKYKKFSKIV